MMKVFALRKRLLLFLFIILMLIIWQPLSAKTLAAIPACVERELKTDISTSILQANKQGEFRLLIMRNRLQNQLWVALAQEQLASLDTQLTMEHGALVAIKNASATLTCVEIRKGSEQRVPCSVALSVCELMPKQWPQTIAAGRWIVENQNLEALLSTINAYGMVTNE